jgi:hypothetical protein
VSLSTRKEIQKKARKPRETNQAESTTDSTANQPHRNDNTTGQVGARSVTQSKIAEDGIEKAGGEGVHIRDTAAEHMANTTSLRKKREKSKARWSERREQT